MNHAMSKHAAIRAQQRGIPPFINQLLDRYGREQYDSRGGIVLYLDKDSIRRMERELGRDIVRRLSPWRHAYKVKSSFDGCTITIGFRSVRVWRK